MAIGDAYATAADYRAQTGKSGTSEDTPIGVALTAVSRYIDKELGRPNGFNKDASAVTRIYDSPSRGGYRADGWAEAENPWKASGGSRARVLDIDDHVSISTIEIDEARDDTFSLTLVSADYELLPRNATKQPESQPYRSIILTEWGSQGYWLPSARIRITGVGGWPAVPSAIKHATIELAAILRLESARATNTINEMNQVLSTSRAAQGIIGELQQAYRNTRSFI